MFSSCLRMEASWVLLALQLQHHFSVSLPLLPHILRWSSLSVVWINIKGCGFFQCTASWSLVSIALCAPLEISQLCVGLFSCTRLRMTSLSFKRLLLCWWMQMHSQHIQAFVLFCSCGLQFFFGSQLQHNQHWLAHLGTLVIILYFILPFRVEDKLCLFITAAAAIKQYMFRPWLAPLWAVLTDVTANQLLEEASKSPPGISWYHQLVQHEAILETFTNFGLGKNMVENPFPLCHWWWHGSDGIGNSKQCLYTCELNWT